MAEGEGGKVWRADEKQNRCWTAARWLDSIGICDLISDAMLARLRSMEGGEGPVSERGFFDALGRVGGEERGRVALALLSESSLLDKLARRVGEEGERLTARMKNGDILSPKFRVGEGESTMVFGGPAHFFLGLGALIGRGGGGGGEGGRLDAMEAEHTMEADSDVFFLSEYHMTSTTSHIEWAFVTDPVDGLRTLGLACWPVDEKLRRDRRRERECRQPTPLSRFEGGVRERNQRLQRVGCAPLVSEELIGARLYTGPMFKKCKVLPCVTVACV